MTILLPWPPTALSPNSRSHWAVKAKAAKSYRTVCWALARGITVPKGSFIELGLEFCPPTRTRRDLDNLLARMKSGLDGIADAMGTDDSYFRPSLRMGEPVPRGCVNVTVRVP